LFPLFWRIMDQGNRISEAKSTTGFWFFLLWAAACLSVFLWKIQPHPLLNFQYLFYSFKYSQWTWLQVFRAWGHQALFFISFTGTLIVFCGIGNRILKWVGLSDLGALENWVWSWALGLGFWGLLAEGLAFENLLFINLMRGMVLSTGAVLLWEDRKQALSRCWPFEPKMEIPSWWLSPCGGVLLLSLSNLLVPEMSWDAITYQLILPKFYFLSHGFYPVTGIVPSHYPSLGQMIFSWGLIWDNDSLARSFSFLAHLGTAFGLVAVGSRLSKPKVGWVAGLFYWIFPYLNLFSTRGYVDLFTGFYSVLGLGYLIVWKKERNKEALGVLAAIALGFIWGIKYNAVSFWLAGLVLFFATANFPKKPRLIGVALIGTFLFFFAPWALKSWVYTNNPVFPHLSGLFQTFDWNDFDAKASAIKFHVEGLRGLLQLPLLPWTALFENYGGAPNEELSLVPLVLLPILVVLLISKWRELR